MGAGRAGGDRDGPPPPQDGTGDGSLASWMGEDMDPLMEQDVFCFMDGIGHESLGWVLQVGQDMGPWPHGWDRTWVLGNMDRPGHVSLGWNRTRVFGDMGPWSSRWNKTQFLGFMDGTRQGSSGWDRTQVLGTTDGPECGSWRPAQDTGPRHSPQLPLPGLLSSADLAEDAIHPGEKVSHGADEADLISDAGDMEPALLARRQELLPCP